ncbi:TonB-dependent receptor [Niveispirillum irakense]|uniref:TonB-dependent receptor n=1 Tax=Niveispirillum irakense TaxID=34011 RepID=UPI00048D4523|nr:TonB-dependent receptor [Niveispirillum irakense]
MLKMIHRQARRRGVSLLALTVALSAAATPALAQSVSGEAESLDEIVVTGFRASLTSALNQKRNETAAIDSIVAEDIGKFPDSNLAESMQRVPGVALARGDGGEGRNISVRGLGAGFTRVRINGMEGSAQTGSSDIYGAGNAGRSFDFNVFSTEIFSALSVRKTPSADVEEGSLGATVDLKAPKPFDFSEDTIFTGTAKGIYNTVSKDVDPRASMLVSHKFGSDNQFGVLASLAYQDRTIREVGYSAVDILSANANGMFCTPIGITPIAPTPGAKGATSTMCSTNNPRTGTVAAYNTIAALRRDDLPNTPGSGAFLPRLPRYLNSEQDQERIGATLTLQYKPSDDTEISFDGLYSRFDVTRRDNYIAAVSFARSITNNGQPMTSVKDIQFDQNGSLVYGLFDGVDVRSEGLVDHFTTTFKQANVDFRHAFSDKFEITGLLGFNRSVYAGKKRFQTFMDAIDTDNFSIDFRDGGTTPKLGFGFDVANPANFAYGPALADGTVTGGFSPQGMPLERKTDNTTVELNGAWSVADGYTLKAGGQFRESDYSFINLRQYLADTAVQSLPAGTTLGSITRQITGVDKLWGDGAPGSWAAIDYEKFADLFDTDSIRSCGIECGAPAGGVRERVKSAYVMGTFDLLPTMDWPVRGDIGMRYVKTNMLASGYIAVAPPTGTTSPTNLVGQYAEAKNSYDDWLPSANLVLEATDDVLLRVSGAKVMARPELASLTPTSGVNPVTRVGNVNNPYLDPIRANTFDAAVEWYFRPGSLLSVAYFYKDIKSFIQNVNSQIPFNQLGLPDALLEGSNTAPTELFTVSQPFNTPGGPLKGFEINAQIPFTFLEDSFFSNFGVLANYTRVTSTINYILASSGGVPTVTTTADLVGLSKNTMSGTVYYEDDKFSIRATANFRDSFIRGIPASPGSDLQGNASTLFVDASASYNLTDQVKLILEATNLTDEQNRLYIDSTRKDTLFETRTGRTFTTGVNVRF